MIAKPGMETKVVLWYNSLMLSPRNFPVGRMLIPLGMLCLLIGSMSVLLDTGDIEAYVTRKVKKEIPWKVFYADEVERGVTAPADTHVVFQVPLEFVRIPREVLF